MAGGVLCLSGCLLVPGSRSLALSAEVSCD